MTTLLETRKIGAAFARCRRGVSTVEFAMIAPVFLLILAGVVDLGGALHAKFKLNAAVSASANFVLVNADKVNAEDGAQLAAQAATIVSSDLPQGIGTVSVAINNGLTFSYADGVGSTTGGVSSADKCFCPQMTVGGVSWGSAVSCGGACASGGTAGKYITIMVAQSYAPLFAGFGVVGEDDRIGVRTVVRPQ
jgi:Flp pilus assembly protein TadG